MIAPLLFDIYAETIIEKIMLTTGIEPPDILFYADDLAVICPIDQTERVIQAVEQEGQKLNMKVNKKKCGILPLLQRGGKATKKSDLNGYPYVNYYKYLGVEVNGKLELEEYLKRIKRKSGFILSRITSTLKNSETETRKFLWSMLIRPLYDYIFPFMEDLSKGLQQKFLQTMRASLKKWIGIRNSVPNGLTATLIGNIEEYIKYRSISAKSKIIERFGKEKGAINHRETIMEKSKLLPSLASIPQEYISLINKLSWTHCSKCAQNENTMVRLTWYHLAKHQILIRNPQLVIEQRIKEWKETKNLPKEEKKRKRREILWKTKIWNNQLMNINKILNTDLICTKTLNSPGSQSP